mgnify:CR=1 FL=1
MNLLFVARTGVFEALTIGLSYLGQEGQLESSSIFGNIATEKTGELIYLGKDQDDNDVYCVGNKYPDIVVRINEEIKSLVESVDHPLKVIPVSVPDSESIYTLSRLAMLPWVGNYFTRIAQSLTMDHKEELLSAGKNFRDRNIETTCPAAKPHK